MEDVLPLIEHKAFINAPVIKVFETITTAHGWDSWFTHGTVIDLENQRIKFNWVDWGPGKVNVDDEGDIISYVPNEEFAFNWHEDTHNTVVKFVLVAKGSGTLLALTESGYLNTSAGQKSMMQDAVGWGEAVTLLKFYLEHGITYGFVPD